MRGKGQAEREDAVHAYLCRKKRSGELSAPSRVVRESRPALQQCRVHAAGSSCCTAARSQEVVQKGLLHPKKRLNVSGPIRPQLIRSFPNIRSYNEGSNIFKEEGQSGSIPPAFKVAIRT